jgi:hypothetical protein
MKLRMPLLLADYLLAFFFDPEDGGSTVLDNANGTYFACLLLFAVF